MKFHYITITALHNKNEIRSQTLGSLDLTLFQISGGACGLVLTANAIMFLTILGFFIAFDGDDVQYSVW